MRADEIREAALSVPPASVAGLTLAGVSLSDWVLILTLGWLAMQIAHFTHTRIKEWTNDGNE